MMQKSVNPGNLHVRLGAVLQLREQALFARDLETVSDMQDTIFDYCSVHMGEKEQAKYDAMPGFLYGDSRSHQEVMRDLRARLRFIFKCVKAHNVFSRAEVETGDASELDDFPEDAAAVAA